MKTIITSTGNSKSDRFDLRFGRAAYFCLYDDETGHVSFHDNKHLAASHGAGPKAAEFAYELGAEKVISGDFGPKAKDVLDKLNIQMAIIENDDQTVGDIIGII